MRSRRLLLIPAALLAAVPVVWACAPYLPNWLLGSDDEIFSGPTGIFAEEIKRFPTTYPGSAFEAAPTRDGHVADLAAAERADLAEAMNRLGLDTLLRIEIMNNVLRLREGLARVRESREALLTGSKPGRPVPSGLTVPASLPPEFADYLEGAIAWYEGRSGAAVQAWERLLRRPADERRFRSTWAAFMLGKVHAHSHPDRAVQWFERTRELAMEGYADSLGLATASYGEEARIELGRKGFARALALYHRQSRAGDPNGLISIRLVAPRLLADPAALADVARDPDARSIFTVWIVSFDPEGKAAWQQALKAADVRDAAAADHLAWAAYLAGDFAAASSWLEQADPDWPMSKWVRARLLLREGKLDEARGLLAEVSKELGNLGISLEEAMDIVYQRGEVLAAPERAAGEEAAIRVVQKDYTGALDRFLRAGYWMDAAYLAEQVLTLDELKAYVDKSWSAELAAKYKPPTGDEWEPILVGGYTEPPDERLARDIRYLLGRRLARDGRLGDAAAYLPAVARPELGRLTAHLAAGRDPRRATAERARDLFQAACLTRGKGMALTGTEVEPDWTLVLGDYDVAEWTFKSRDVRRQNRVLRQTPDEAARVQRNRTTPWKRYHYRYRAADLAWEAAGLLPSGDEKAAMLATAGSWLGARDPKAADRFYKQLVRCCGSTDLGREAEELRWLPEADACEGPTAQPGNGQE